MNHNTNSDLNSFSKASEMAQEDVLAKDSTLSNDSEFNSNLQRKILSLSDLGIYLRFRYGNNDFAGLKAGISRTRVRQILIGYNLPKSVRLIRQLSKGWEIDEIVLTQLFENCRREHGN